MKDRMSLREGISYLIIQWDFAVMQVELKYWTEIRVRWIAGLIWELPAWK
jgi:hypothetical protein